MESEEQASGTDAAVLGLFIYAMLYHSIHHIVAAVFPFGCLQRTYSLQKNMGRLQKCHRF